MALSTQAKNQNDTSNVPVHEGESVYENGISLVDMHCHLGFASDALTLANWAQQQGFLLFSNTVTPQEWLAQKESLANYSAVTVGFGMHPWWVNETTDPQKIVAQLESEQPYALGEIGLDFSSRHRQTSALQKEIFSDILSWAAKTGDHILSIHAVKAVSDALAILKSSDVTKTCTCIFHRFNGSLSELEQALEARCYFSMGKQSLETSKGREYVKLIPVDRLFIESDLPSQPQTSLAPAQLLDALCAAADTIASIKGSDSLPAIMEQSASLLTQGGHCVE